MKRDTVLRAVCGTVAVGGAISCAVAQEHRDRPNVILIYTDDMGYGDLGCYGNPSIATPNIDRMAAEGVRMTSFYSSAAVSSPSRAGLLTGRYQVRMGMYGDRVSVLFPDTPRGLPEEEITIADILKKAGYSTALIGKWHQGHAHPYLPSDNGFDYFFGLYSPNNYKILPLIDNEEVVQDFADRPNLTQMYTAHAKKYIADHRDTPFFLFLSHTYPHMPVMSSKEFEHKSRRGKYGDCVEEIDWSVGEIFRTLREQGLDGNTLVIFTSDNGPWLRFTPNNGGSAGPLRGGKGSCWEGGFRMPGIFWFPKKLSPAVCYDMACQLDLLPTITKLCGGKLPDDRPIDGVDIMPLLRNGRKVRNEFAYYCGSRLSALRRGKFKAIFEVPDDWYTDTPFLADTSKVDILIFDIETDFDERRNLAPKHADMVASFKELYEQYLNNVNVAPSIFDERPEDK